MKGIAKTLFCLTLLALMVCSISAQNAAKNWIFGNHGWIDFNTVSPTSPSMPAPSTFVSSEGSSSISNSNGNLLFYTNGVTVWNRDHIVMPHGTGLMGSTASTQSALIVPCTCDKYFIFTTGAWNSTTAGVRYSLVDMTAAGGMGDITAKNVLLLADPAAEKLAAVKDGNGGLWVVAHDERSTPTGSFGNRFLSYRVQPGSCSVSQTAVQSGVGSFYTGGSHRYGKGQMKISPDGKRLAVAGFDDTAGFIELFKFDTATGMVSDLDGTVPQVIARTAYGIEFSPNSQYLYASVRSTTGNSLYRYYIGGNTLPPPDWLFNFWVKKRPVGSLQLAPDGKIYVAVNGSPYLYVIDNPNAANTSLTVSTFTLSSVGSTYGLPAMVAGDFACFNTSLPGGGCACDQVTQTPFWQNDLSVAWKAFSIYNVKSPGSKIKSIDIDISDVNTLPPPQGWLGGGLKVNGTALSVPEWWRFPYTRIPNGTNNIQAIAADSNYSIPTVTFNLGLEWSQPFTGTVKLKFTHEDGSICQWTSDDWTPGPPPSLAMRVSEKYLGDLQSEFLPLALGFSGGINIKSNAKWIAVEPLDEDTEVFSVDGGGEIGNEDKADQHRLVTASSRKQERAALYELAKPVSLEQVNTGEIRLVLKRSQGNSGKPRLRFLFFDENANLIGFATNEDK